MQPRYFAALGADAALALRYDRRDLYADHKHSVASDLVYMDNAARAHCSFDRNCTSCSLRQAARNERLLLVRDGEFSRQTCRVQLIDVFGIDAAAEVHQQRAFVLVGMRAGEGSRNRGPVGHGRSGLLSGVGK